MADLSAAEREAMVRAGDYDMRQVTGRQGFENGWLAARDFYVLPRDAGRCGEQVSSSSSPDTTDSLQCLLDHAEMQLSDQPGGHTGPLERRKPAPKQASDNGKR